MAEPTTTQAERAELLRSRHRPGEPLVLPNAWDVASARRLEEAGFVAIATTSGGVAEALGYSDREGTPAPVMLAAVRRIARSVAVPVTADMEAGYGLTPGDLVEELLATGAVGLNLEDSRHGAGAGTASGAGSAGAASGAGDSGHEPLVAAEGQAERIAAVKEAGRRAGVDLVLNARVDVHVRQVGAREGRLDEALRRGRLYREAGADCIYPIGVDDEETIGALVRGLHAPVNVMARPGAPTLDRLVALGVARISFGSGLMRATMRRLEQLAADLRAGRFEALGA